MCGESRESEKVTIEVKQKFDTLTGRKFSLSNETLVIFGTGLSHSFLAFGKGFHQFTVMLKLFFVIAAFAVYFAFKALHKGTFQLRGTIFEPSLSEDCAFCQ